MLKAFLLASAVITCVAGSAQAAGLKGSYYDPMSSSQRYARQKAARVAAHARIATNNANAAINAGMQNTGAKYDAAMNAATNDLKRVVTGTTCVTCR